jgi:hypothetical protein
MLEKKPGRPSLKTIRGLCMSIRDASYLKTQRLLQIKKHIAKQFPNPVNLELMILWIEVNIGLTHDRAFEYITTVCMANQWNLKDGSITPLEVNHP